MLLMVSNGLRLTLNTLTAAWGDTLQLGLFELPHTPSPADDIATYQAIESTFLGYARQPVAGWLPAAVISPAAAAALASLLTFEHAIGGSPASVYGYFVVDHLNNLLFAEAYPNGPQHLTSGSPRYVVAPSFSLTAIPALCP